MSDKIVTFLQSKNFRLVEELGRGACGRTVKLHDEVIDEIFVCKKYEPIVDEYKEELFNNFIREIKLLFMLHHQNIVRVFNYYIYPEFHNGYILMEFIEGTDIEDYLKNQPENVNDIFAQCIDGFRHLEKSDILHRDIRPMNILVTDDHTVKIIDFGFGKKIGPGEDFDKSISLNWWCEPPNDFASERYDFATEVYFVGKLFEKIVSEHGIDTFKYGSLLSQMCAPDPDMRIDSFSAIQSEISGERFSEIEFSASDRSTYRVFADQLTRAVSKIESDCKYVDGPEAIQKKLEESYRKVMLEEHAPANNLIIGCFLNGAFYFSKHLEFRVSDLKSFMELLRSSSTGEKNIIMHNILSRLDVIQRYEQEIDLGDDIPF